MIVKTLKVSSVVLNGNLKLHLANYLDDGGSDDLMFVVINCL